MDKVVKSALACTVRAMLCAASTLLEDIAPGALVFGRDMLLNIPIVTDIIAITENRHDAGPGLEQSWDSPETV